MLKFFWDHFVHGYVLNFIDFEIIFETNLGTMVSSKPSLLKF